VSHFALTGIIIFQTSRQSSGPSSTTDWETLNHWTSPCGLILLTTPSDHSVQPSGGDSSVGVTLQANTPKPELIVVPEGGQLSWRLSQKCREFYVSHKRNCTNGKWRTEKWQAWNGSGSGRFQDDIPDIRLRTFIKICHDDQCTGPSTITGCLHKGSHNLPSKYKFKVTVKRQQID
jgi:hypothetical protein